MQEIFELIQVDGASELWRPVKQAVNVMQFNGEPKLGDFLVDNDGVSHFVRPEPTRVTIKAVNGDQLQVDLGPNELPNWFAHLMHTGQINNRNGMNLNGQSLKAGVDIVFDGQSARVEEHDGAVLSTH